jgi:hypothetical protein
MLHQILTSLFISARFNFTFTASFRCCCEWISGWAWTEQILFVRSRKYHGWSVGTSVYYDNLAGYLLDELFLDVVLISRYIPLHSHSIQRQHNNTLGGSTFADSFAFRTLAATPLLAMSAQSMPNSHSTRNTVSSQLESNTRQYTDTS